MLEAEVLKPIPSSDIADDSRWPIHTLQNVVVRKSGCSTLTSLFTANAGVAVEVIGTYVEIDDERENQCQTHSRRI